jgi:hypothetical protein
VMVVGTKNIISFGVTYGLTPMVTQHGYKWACGVVSCLVSPFNMGGWHDSSDLS